MAEMHADKTPYEHWLEQEPKMDSHRLPKLLGRGDRRPWVAYTLAAIAVALESAFVLGFTTDFVPALPRWVEFTAIGVGVAAGIAAGIELWLRHKYRAELTDQVHAHEEIASLADLLGAGYRGQDQTDSLPEALVRVAVTAKNGHKLNWSDARIYVLGLRRGYARMRELQWRFEFRSIVGDVLMLPAPKPKTDDQDTNQAA